MPKGRTRSRPVALSCVIALALAAGPARAANPVRLNGSGSALDLMKPLLAAYATAHPGSPKVESTAPLGSSGAVMALLAGAIDLAVLSRPVLPEEAARGVRGRPLGKTPLLLVTNASIARKAITLRELEAIWAGDTATWPDGQPIRVVLRPEKETNTQLLTRLSPGMRDADARARKHPWAIVAVTDPEANALVVRTRGAIGAASLVSLIVDELPLTPMTLDGVPGTVETLAQGRYPMAKEIVFATGPRTSAAALAILDFVFSPQGRAISARSGLLLTEPNPTRP